MLGAPEEPSSGRSGTHMISVFSGSEIPAEKLFVLYYPPTMSHQKWDKSVYAATRAKEALDEAVRLLKSFHSRYVLGPGLALHLAIGAAGLALLGYWLWVLLTGWAESEFVSAFLAPFAGAALTLYGRFRLKRFLDRRRLWNESGAAAVATELKAMEKAITELPDDPDAEEAAPAMRRECPVVLSEIAFQGVHYHAFTYLDFVLFPHLKHPSRREELPSAHSLHRDAYYVGEVVYDSWRLFQKDNRDLADPRFAGSGGRRGVI